MDLSQISVMTGQSPFDFAVGRKSILEICGCKFSQSVDYRAMCVKISKLHLFSKCAKTFKILGFIKIGVKAIII